ncbi:hypothetical protein [Mesorhizobium sp. Z1-4]|uniref:hypothetical protein n=1 Tax=Mesorhizobium sp. Z1-4 TaxID=2448478 RepID=UPI000FD78021|nr:hypothetical protein [Mesorhizobium sp. Z1-4]
MPEQHRQRRGLPPYRLSAARDQGALFKAVCYCGSGRARWYVPADLITLFGDIDCSSVGALMRCESCREPMRVAVQHPTAGERQAIRVRRLERVWTVRRAKWRVESA